MKIKIGKALSAKARAKLHKSLVKDGIDNGPISKSTRTRTRTLYKSLKRKAR